MALSRPLHRLLLPALLLPAMASLLAPTAAEAGPLVRRAQERKACQEFAGKLQTAQANPAQAQMVYQQGVLKLVQTFGENPCGDIPAPTAAAPAAAAPGPVAASTTTAAPATASPATAPASQAANPQQQQACQQFAAKLDAAKANPAQAKQVYAMGNEKLSGMFGPNPCPQVKAP
jgi:hypothetical protein